MIVFRIGQVYIDAEGTRMGILQQLQDELECVFNKGRDIYTNFVPRDDLEAAVALGEWKRVRL